jgi:hypothetical protein
LFEQAVDRAKRKTDQLAPEVTRSEVKLGVIRRVDRVLAGIAVQGESLTEQAWLVTTEAHMISDLARNIPSLR